MIEEIDYNLYRIEIPLPKNPLRTINSYLIKGNDRFLIIDTGMNREECLGIFDASLKELDVDLQKTDFFITHFHSDHLGLAPTLATEKSIVYLNQTEITLVTAPTYNSRWTTLQAFYMSHGFPEEEIKRALTSNPGFLYGPKCPIAFTAISDGDRVEIGDYSLTCIETPGHAPGHTCLYDADKKILFSGDHILFDITPNIGYAPDYLGMSNPLGSYLQSLDKVYPLEVNLVLPGHRTRRNNHRSRIKQLQKHHAIRLQEIIGALDAGAKTAYDVAAHITWEIRYKTWDQFPIAQKYFAVSETVAHLEHLVAQNKVKKNTVNGHIEYWLI